MNNQTNPFLASVEGFLSVEGLPERLAFSPLNGLDVGNMSLDERLDILDRLPEEFFEPTSSSVDIASRLYRLIRNGYLHRDPTQLNVKKITMELAGHTGQTLSALPWHSTSAKGMTVMGITGLGKSHEVERALKLIPQCIEHGPCRAAGWAKMTQVVWIKVPMSHDGSMGGLLLQILTEFDRLVGSHYSQDKALLRLTVEKLAVQVSILFRNHGLGVLVIDEIQPRNFEGNGRGGLTTTFFLRLLNLGIPTVLIGNPLGIGALQAYSQDARRIGSGGTIYVHPAESTDFDWESCWVPALKKQNLMNDPLQVEYLDERLFRYSGGIRAYAGRVLFAAQRLALELGLSSITAEHLEDAFLGADFSDTERDIINGFANKKYEPLVQFDDIPWMEYKNKWHRSIQADVPEEDPAPPALPISNGKSQSIPKSVSSKDKGNIKRQRTRKSNQAISIEITKNSLSPDDMRADGLKSHLISSLADLMASGPG